VGTQNTGYAFIWDATNGLRNLQDVLTNDYGLGAQLTGWQLTWATGISDDGNVIVGNGVYTDSNLNEYNEAWRVTLGTPPPLNNVVSRKNHGNLTPPGDLPLNSDTPTTIECRSGGIPSGTHTLVFNFVNTLDLTTPVNSITATATTSSGTQTLSPAGNLGTDDAHQYFVTLNDVPNASHVYVTLRGVKDSNANLGNIAAHMDVLFGDVNSTGRTDSGDVTQVRNRTISIPDTTNPASFRYDVNTSGRIDAGDVTATRNATVTVLP
jgi:hypothetical protein